jgi:hypothetical protein
MKIIKITGDVARHAAIDYVMNAPIDYVVKVSEPNRTLEQNAAQWPILDAIAKQVQWPVNGVMCLLCPEDFKDVLTAAHKGEHVRLAQGVNGGVVMLGQRTSKFNKKTFSDWIEYLHWFCAEKGVEL